MKIPVYLMVKKRLAYCILSDGCLTGIDTLLGEVTLSKLFCLPSKKDLTPKGKNLLLFCDFLLTFQHTNPLLKKGGSTLKGKNLLPREANSFLLEKILFQKGG